MSSVLTKNMSLKKPHYKDSRWDIPLNENFDILDEQVPRAANRNRVINGDFEIWQRGNGPFTGVTSGYHADSWLSRTSGGNAKLTVEKTTIGNGTGMKVTVTKAFSQGAAKTCYLLPIEQRFEQQEFRSLGLAGKNITISFLFRAKVAGIYTISFKKLAPTDSFIHDFTYNTAGAIQKIVVTVPLGYGPTGPYADGTSLGFIMTFATVTGTGFEAPSAGQWHKGKDFYSSPNAHNWGGTVGNYVEVGEVQVEEGDAATEFERVPFATQLWRCQRYFCKVVADFRGTITTNVATGAPVSFPNWMRQNPKLTYTVKHNTGFKGNPFSTGLYQGGVVVCLNASRNGGGIFTIPVEADSDL